MKIIWEDLRHKLFADKYINMHLMDKVTRTKLKVDKSFPNLPQTAIQNLKIGWDMMCLKITQLCVLLESQNSSSIFANISIKEESNGHQKIYILGHSILNDFLKFDKFKRIHKQNSKCVEINFLKIFCRKMLYSIFLVETCQQKSHFSFNFDFDLMPFLCGN